MKTSVESDAPSVDRNRGDQDRAGGGAAEAALTPAMRQYRAAKEQYPDTLLFFRMGDFYELFFEDAVVASRELQLTLTARDKARSVPMCGVPYHAVDNYLHRLLRRGYRVAVCEQMEDPKLAKGVVKREVTRVHTPGTAIDPAMEAGQSCWLAAVCAAAPAKGATACYGLAFLDLSTGEMRATEVSGRDGWGRVLSEIGRMRPAELLHSESLRLEDGTVGTGAGVPGAGGGTLRLGLEPAGRGAEMAATAPPEMDSVRVRTAIEDWVVHPEYAVPLLLRQMRVQSVDGLGLGGHAAAAGAVAALLEYLKRTRQGALEHIDGVRFFQASDSLEMDATTVRNLELVEPLAPGGDAQGTLLGTVDACLTAMGKRMLRLVLLRPTCDAREMVLRHEAVGELAAGLQAREGMRAALDGVMDLERLLSRIALDTATPRDVQALRRTLERLPGVLGAMEPLRAERWRALAERLDTLADCAERIAGTLADELPAVLGDGTAVREGVSAELDELRALSQNGRAAIAGIEERERSRTGIASLKVRFNNVFGYYLEVTKANARSVPADYERKQTLVNAERYTTPELKELEGKILHAQERSIVLEREIFAALKRSVLEAAGRVRETARRVAEADLLAGFAHVAAHRGWTRPVVEDQAAEGGASAVLEILGGRHPVVEQRMEASGAGRFVPNSLFLDATEGAEARPTLALITGPNMGGKSTYLRMTALLVVLAQSGSFVPAERMRFGLVDRIFTRIGASDNLAQGRSTFMVEMTETAAILNQATSRSLLLLDEMGRGTATYDGLSLAWATVEFLHDAVRARALFATHYHELTLLAETLPRLENLRVTVKESNGGIVFLHAVERGAASKSYGIEVARLAGLPRTVIERSREVLRAHERAEGAQLRAELPATTARTEPVTQMTMFTPLSQRIVDRVEELDLDSMTPREALALLAELQTELRAGR